jgi:hypothetical protein
MISTPQWLFAAAFFTVRHYSHIHYANASAHYGLFQLGLGIIKGISKISK